MVITDPQSTSITRLFKYIENFIEKKKKKNENFQIIVQIFFHISVQNIDCGYSLEPPGLGGSMFLAEIRKIMYTPVNPNSTIQEWRLGGLKLYRHVFVMTTDMKKALK